MSEECPDFLTNVMEIEDLETLKFQCLQIYEMLIDSQNENKTLKETLADYDPEAVQKLNHQLQDKILEIDALHQSINDFESKILTFKQKAAEVDNLKDELNMLNRVHENKCTTYENNIANLTQEMSNYKDKNSVLKDDNTSLLKINKELNLKIQKINEQHDFDEHHDVNHKFVKFDTGKKLSHNSLVLLNSKYEYLNTFRIASKDNITPTKSKKVQKFYSSYETYSHNNSNSKLGSKLKYNVNNNAYKYIQSKITKNKIMNFHNYRYDYINFTNKINNECNIDKIKFNIRNTIKNLNDLKISKKYLKNESPNILNNDKYKNLNSWRISTKVDNNIFMSYLKNVGLSPSKKTKTNINRYASNNDINETKKSLSQKYHDWEEKIDMMVNRNNLSNSDKLPVKYITRVKHNINLKESHQNKINNIGRNEPILSYNDDVLKKAMSKIEKLGNHLKEKFDLIKSNDK